MPIFPLSAVALTVILDGQPLRSYIPATVESGHAVGPVEPFITRIADRVDYAKPYLIVTRGSRSARVLLLPQAQGMSVRVPIATIARTLGLRVTYNAKIRTLSIVTPAKTLQTLQPFGPNAPQPTPTTLFTPIPTSTPRPIWTGSPRPRRTPLPAGSL